MHQSKWAVRVLSRGAFPGCFTCAEQLGVDAARIDPELALRGFSRDLSTGERNERLAAVDALGWLRDPRGVSPLLRASSDAYWEVRYRALRNVAHLAPLPEWALPALARRLRDEHPPVRIAAASALGAVRSREALALLTTAFEDPFSPVRAAAARAVWALGEERVTSAEAVAALAELLEDDAAEVAHAAYWALAAQGGSAADPVRAAWRYSDRGQRAWNAVVGSR
jgi:HEAT repeat protein